tara:strand:+ start:567 stop:974 length:408 start_codon:yes stop_codon:yes gene_type:complete
MALDKFDRPIQPRQYAMILSTHWKSNDVHILFVQIADREPTPNRVYYKRFWTLRGDIQEEEVENNLIVIREEITWTSPSKILLIDETTFVDGNLHTTFKHLRNEFTDKQIVDQLAEAVQRSLNQNKPLLSKVNQE